MAEYLLDIQIKKKKCLEIYFELEIQVVPAEILVVCHSSYIWKKLGLIYLTWLDITSKLIHISAKEILQSTFV